LIVAVLFLHYAAASETFHFDGSVAPAPPVFASVSMYWWGGIPTCSNCGDQGEYACSFGIGEWNNGTQIFQDPLTKLIKAGAAAPNYVLSSINATIFGSYGCVAYDYTRIRASVQGQFLDITGWRPTTLRCKCNTCNGDITFTSSAMYPGGIPGYLYGGNNTITFDILQNSACLSSVTVNLTYTVPVSTRIQYGHVLALGSGSPDQEICGVYVANSFCPTDAASVSFRFQDPLPPGTVLIQANARVFGVWKVNDQALWTLGLGSQSTPVGTFTLPDYSSLTSWSVCSGSADTGPSEVYQGGWPGYSYGGTNTLTLSPADHYETRKNCFGFVELSLTYYKK